jgi:hypothetical protein
MFSCLLAVAAGGSPACESLLAASCPEASPGRGGRGGRGGAGRGGPRGACERCTGVIQHSLRVAGCTAVDVAAYCNQIATARWHHKWDTGAEMWFSDFGYSTLTPAQAQFVAEHNEIVSLEKCVGSNVPGLKTEDAIYQTAAQLKALKPSIKVMFYWATDQQGLHCYAANQTFAAHPEWWLRDDAGKYVLDGTQHVIDWTVAGAVEWWLSVPFSGANAEGLIDGVLADSGGYKPYPGISPARCGEIYTAKKAALGRLQAAATELNGGVILANALSMYASQQNPAGGRTAHNLDVLDAVDAIQNEHFAVFESVNKHNDSLNVEMVKENLALIEQAAADPAKLVFVSTWPGLFVTTGSGKPGPGTGPGWPTYPAPPSPHTMDAWRSALLDKFEFAFAATLLVAAPNVYQTYGVWYEMHQGFVDCPTQPSTCCTPPQWYPQLSKPLGAPLGPREQVGPYHWTRDFEHARVDVDLAAPDSASITFRGHDSLDGSSGSV